MLRPYGSLIILILLLAAAPARGQKTIRVSDPRLELRDNVVYISYDILNSDANENYEVTLEVEDTASNRIAAHALSGDVGAKVPGGSNKVIQWDLGADGMVLEADIFIRVRARLVPSSVAETNRSFNRAGLMVQSVALPGLGLTRVTGNPHWIKGIAAYGCLAGSIVFNRLAIASYDEYLAQRTAENAQVLYQDASNHDLVSEGLAYAAIGIWVTDLVWTYLGTRDVGSGMTGRQDALSMVSGFDPIFRIPSVGFRFRF